MQKEVDGAIVLETKDEIDGVKSAIYYSSGFGVEDTKGIAAKTF